MRYFLTDNWHKEFINLLFVVILFVKLDILFFKSDRINQRNGIRIKTKILIQIPFLEVAIKRFGGDVEHVVLNGKPLIKIGQVAEVVHTAISRIEE